MNANLALNRSSSGVKNNLENYLFILPAILIFVVFHVYPFFQIFHLSLREWDGIGLSSTFIWFDNFKELLGDAIWWQSMRHAGYITLFALLFQNVLAFALALACDREMKLRGFYRAVYFIPPILSEIVVALLWKWILYADMQEGQHIGLLNHFLNQIGLPHLINAWLSDPKTALTCIAVVHSWKGFGWGFVMLLAGLQMIDRQLYEAARVDGAGPFRVFWSVTMPMMLPVTVAVMILTVLGSMQVFVLIIGMVGQGLIYYTEVPATRILATMLSGHPRFGYACAMGVSFGVMLIFVSLLMKSASDRIKQF